MADEDMEKKILELSKIPGVGVRFSKRLYDAGYKTPEDLKYATEEDLLKIPGMTQERARTILSGVKEIEREEIEDEEIERTIQEMKKEIAEIEESVERGEDIKFKVVKAKAELAPVILSDTEKEEESETEEQVGEVPQDVEQVVQPEPEKPKTIAEKSETPQQVSPRKKMPVIRGEEKKPRASKRIKIAVAVFVTLLLIFSTLFMFYTVFSGKKEPIEIDGNFSDWEGKLFYKMTKQVPVKDVEINRVSVVASENNLYFYAEVSGFFFMGKADGVDALLVFVDVDSDSNTGYLVGGGGADYKIELVGWDTEVVRASFTKYTSTLNQNDWNAWEPCGNVLFRVDKERMEAKVKLQAQNPRCLFYAKHVDSMNECVCATESYVFPQTPSLHVNVKLSGDRVLEKGTFNPLIEMQFTAKGGYVALRNITLPGNLGQIKLKFANSGSDAYLPWSLAENQPQSIQVFLQPSDDLTSGSQININSVLVESDARVHMNAFHGNFYIAQAPQYIQIDGAFQDWENISPIIDTDSEELPDQINILECKVLASRSAFFMEVKSGLMQGTEVPLGKLVRGSSGGSGTPQPHSIYGKDWLRVYVDTSPTLNAHNNSAGIVNGYLIEIGGISGRITDTKIYAITNGAKSESSHEITVAKNETAIEFIVGFVLPGSSYVYYFEAESWEGQKDVVEPFQPLTRYYHEETQVSFGTSFWLLGTGDDILYDLCTGDMNNDGLEDIVTVGKTSTGNEVILWKNVGGNFQKETLYNTNVNVYTCALGDFDWNGWLDIVIGTAANPGNSLGKREISIFTNQNFIFTQVEIDAFNLEVDVNSLSVIDFNRDGYLDILCGASVNTGYELISYRNDHTTGFNFFKEDVVNLDKNVLCVETEHLDIDVLGDLVYSTESNNGQEVGIMSFTSVWKPMGTFGDGNDVRGVKIADFNNDALNDVVFATDKLQVLVAVAPNFVYDLTTYSIGTNVYSLTTCDFDNDGFSDIIAGCDNGSVYAFENKRNGSFEMRYLGNAGATKIWDIGVFDYDRDGDMDIVLVSDNKNLYILNNTLLHRNFDLYLDSETQLSDSRPIVAMAVSDLDNDGDMDIVTAHSDEFSASIYAWKNPGDAHTSPFGASWERCTVTSDFVRIYALECGDVDNDGYAEVVFSGHNGSKNLLCVATAQKNPWGNSWVWDWEEWYDPGMDVIPVGKITQISLADMNRDGIIDVVCGDTDGWLVVYKRGSDSITDHNGDWLDNTARFQNNTVLALATADMDNDGWTDIVCGYDSNVGIKSGIIWKNLKNPFNVSGWQQYFFDGVDKNITSLALADLNRDGYLDVACVVNGTQSAKVWRNPQNLSMLWNWNNLIGFTNIATICASDVNNNGWDDVVLGMLNGVVAYVEGSTGNFTYCDTGHAPLSLLKLVNLDRKSNYDGNDDDVIIGSLTSCYFYKNRGANSKIEGIKLLSSSLIPGETRALMMLNITHNGISGDNSIYLASIVVRFLSTTGIIMYPQNLSALFENVSVWLDADGNQGFNNITDKWLAGIYNYSDMYAGFLRITLPKTVDSLISPTQTKSFFIVVKMKTSIPSNYSNYQFNISVWAEDGDLQHTWNIIYDGVTYGVATIREAGVYYSNNYSVYIVPEGIGFLILFLVGLNAVCYRKLRGRAF
ncbi:MAG: FG-GAP-like repeat-containing protein [Thermoplasmata archaeon]